MRTTKMTQERQVWIDKCSRHSEPLHTILWFGKHMRFEDYIKDQQGEPCYTYKTLKGKIDVDNRGQHIHSLTK